MYDSCMGLLSYIRRQWSCTLFLRTLHYLGILSQIVFAWLMTACLLMCVLYETIVLRLGAMAVHASCCVHCITLGFCHGLYCLVNDCMFVDMRFCSMTCCCMTYHADRRQPQQALPLLLFTLVRTPLDCDFASLFVAWSFALIIWSC